MIESDAARVIARLAHKGQKYGDHDYFLHHIEGVVGLMSRTAGCTFGHATVAYLHDVLEDTDVTALDLEELGFSEDVIESVKAMTHQKGESYEDYIDRLVQDKVAAIVKYYDLEFNIQAGRAARKRKETDTPHNRARIIKYRKAQDKVKLALTGFLTTPEGLQL